MQTKRTQRHPRSRTINLTAQVTAYGVACDIGRHNAASSDHEIIYGLN